MRWCAVNFFNKYFVCWTYISSAFICLPLLLSVHGPFSDRVGLPLHTISFCHEHLLCRSQFLPCPLLHSLTMSFLVFQPVFCLELNSIHFFIQASLHFLITCPYHLSLPLLMTVVIGSIPTSLFNSSPVLPSFMETPHIHLTIRISALSNLTQHQLVRAQSHLP